MTDDPQGQSGYRQPRPEGCHRYPGRSRRDASAFREQGVGPLPGAHLNSRVQGKHHQGSRQECLPIGSNGLRGTVFWCLNVPFPASLQIEDRYDSLCESQHYEPDPPRDVRLEEGGHHQRSQRGANPKPGMEHPHSPGAMVHRHDRIDPDVYESSGKTETEGCDQQPGPAPGGRIPDQTHRRQPAGDQQNGSHRKAVAQKPGTDRGKEVPHHVQGDDQPQIGHGSVQVAGHRGPGDAKSRFGHAQDHEGRHAQGEQSKRLLHGR